MFLYPFEKRDKAKFELKTFETSSFFIGRMHFCAGGKRRERKSESAFTRLLARFHFEERAVSGWSLINLFLCIREYVGQSCCIRVENRSYTRSRFFSSLTWRVEKNRLLFSFLFLFSIQNCQIFREIALLRRYFSRILSCNIFLLPSRVSRALLRLFARQINVSLKGILGSFKKMSELKATKS